MLFDRTGKGPNQNGAVRLDGRDLGDGGIGLLVADDDEVALVELDAGVPHLVCVRPSPSVRW